MEQPQDFWRKCSACKKPIGFNQKYFVCSVSTCNGQRTGYVFCSVFCWEVHVPGANHRSAGAIEKMSPGKSEEAPRRVIVSGPVASSSNTSSSRSQVPREILIVASKLKDYIRLKSEMNTSADVMEALSDIVRRECDRAIESARADGRKTVMERDFKKT
jgi:hypothetical protein